MGQAATNGPISFILKYLLGMIAVVANTLSDMHQLRLVKAYLPSVPPDCQHTTCEARMDLHAEAQVSSV